MKDIIFYFYGYVVFFYSLGLMVSYVILMWLAELGILRSKHSHLSVYPKYIMDNSPYTPGVSIIAPAYNEEKTIVNNVNSLLAQEYPIFEVVIVNDGSRDKTLELLIEHFSLVEVPFAYVEYIHTKPYRRLFKSTRTEYKRLIVIQIHSGMKSISHTRNILHGALKYAGQVTFFLLCLIFADSDKETVLLHRLRPLDHNGIDAPLQLCNKHSVGVKYDGKQFAVDPKFSVTGRMYENNRIRCLCAVNEKKRKYPFKFLV